MRPYQHPEWNALLAGIVAQPDVDLPRLVAADWLEENGDADRAMFIRIQCERAISDSQELKWAEDRFRYSPTGLSLWAAEACPSLVRLDDSAPTGLGLAWIGVEKVEFRRGFPFRIQCTAEEWQRYADLILPRQPVEELVLRECREPGLDWWAMFPTLRYLKRIALDDGDYPTLMFLRRQLPEIEDIVRHSALVPVPRIPTPGAPAALPAQGELPSSAQMPTERPAGDPQQ